MTCQWGRKRRGARPSPHSQARFYPPPAQWRQPSPQDLRWQTGNQSRSSFRSVPRAFRAQVGDTAERSKSQKLVDCSGFKVSRRCGDRLLPSGGRSMQTSMHTAAYRGVGRYGWLLGLGLGALARRIWRHRGRGRRRLDATQKPVPDLTRTAGRSGCLRRPGTAGRGCRSILFAAARLVSRISADWPQRIWTGNTTHSR